MPLFRVSSNEIEKIKYLFIDGGCLDCLLEIFSKELFGGQVVEIDYLSLASGFQKVFYYDCLPAQKKDEDESDYQTRIQPKIKLFNHLKSLDRFHVYEGTARFRDKRRGQEQKQVDIMIAVDMLTHSFRRNMHEATLLTSDLDFKPLIDALVQEGMYVSLWYPKGKTNYELVDAADSKQPLTIDFIKHWLTESFQSKIQLPRNQEMESLNLDISWSQVDKIEGYYKAHFYENQGLYAAVVPTENSSYFVLKHNNLSQLKFYVDNIFGVNVRRPEND